MICILQYGYNIPSIITLSRQAITTKSWILIINFYTNRKKHRNNGVYIHYVHIIFNDLIWFDFRINLKSVSNAVQLHTHTRHNYTYTLINQKLQTQIIVIMILYVHMYRYVCEHKSQFKLWLNAHILLVATNYTGQKGW